MDRSGHQLQINGDVLDLIAYELCLDSDTRSLGRLCQASKLCMQVARQDLYRELDLVKGTFEGRSTGRPSVLRHLTQSSRNLRRSIQQSNPHLLAYARSLHITLERTAEVKIAPPTNTLFEPLLISLSPTALNIQHVHIVFGDPGTATSCYYNHFPVLGHVRQALESFLQSPTLRSLQVDLYTFIRTVEGNNGPFPSWIFRGISKTISQVQLRIACPLARSIIPNSFSSNAPPIKSEAPKLAIEELELRTSVSSQPVELDAMSRYTSVLSGLCFNFALHQLKRLKIYHPKLDNTLWSLPHAATAIGELTIFDYPNAHDRTGLSISRNHFSSFTALRFITLHFTFNPDNAKYDACQSIIDLFSVPTPPTLEKISLFVYLGCFLNERIPALFNPEAHAILQEWSLLDESLAAPHHTSLREVFLELKWSTKKSSHDRRSSPLAAPLPDTAQMGAESELRGHLEKVLARTRRRGLLNLVLTHASQHFVHNSVTA